MCVFVRMKETVGELSYRQKCLCDCSCAVTREAARQLVNSRVKNHLMHHLQTLLSLQSALAHDHFRGQFSLSEMSPPKSTILKMNYYCYKLLTTRSGAF